MDPNTRADLVAAIAEALREIINHRPAPKLLVTVDEAAAMLSVSPRTIEGLIDSGTIRARTVRRKIRVSVRSLTEFAERSH